MSLLPDRINKAIAAGLAEQGYDAEVRGSMEDEATLEFNTRIICQAEESQELAAHIKGVFVCSGSINIIQSIDETDGLEKFRFLCDEVKHIVGSETGFKDMIQSKDPAITVYHRSVRIGSMSVDAGTRGWKGTLSWSCVASDTPTTN
jgi:hypothetical protein